jgi:hypothetical protein
MTSATSLAPIDKLHPCAAPQGHERPLQARLQRRKQ